MGDDYIFSIYFISVITITFKKIVYISRYRYINNINCFMLKEKQYKINIHTLEYKTNIPR